MLRCFYEKQYQCRWHQLSALRGWELAHQDADQPVPGATARQGVADLFDLLCAGQGGFLDLTRDLFSWARANTPDSLVIGYLRADKEVQPPQSLEAYRQKREQR